MTLDPALEAARQAARSAISRASLRAVAAEIGIAHNSLSELVKAGSVRAPYGAARAKLLAWAEQRGAKAPDADRASYFRGKQDALMGMIQYIATQQAEIGKFLAELPGGDPSGPATPYVSVGDAEEAEEILDQLPPLQKAKPQPKRRPA